MAKVRPRKRQRLSDDRANDPMPPSVEFDVLTIGHSNLPADRFVALLEGAGVTAVADVRSVPFSRRFPWFSGTRLAERLAEAGIAYVPMGDAHASRLLADLRTQNYRSRVNPRSVRPAERPGTLPRGRRRLRGDGGNGRLPRRSRGRHRAGTAPPRVPDAACWSAARSPSTGS